MYSDGDEFDEVYSGNGRESLMDNDSMSAEEDAFMQGYDEIPEGSEEEREDKIYEEAFKKKARRSKRKENIFDEEELEADVLLH
ncbi:MAG: hypothetical protein AB7V77_05935 [Candidatus Woesearchaeota archaeon]